MTWIKKALLEDITTSAPWLDVSHKLIRHALDTVVCTCHAYDTHAHIAGHACNTHTHIHINAHTHTHLCMHARVSMHNCLLFYTFICICIYIHYHILCMDDWLFTSSSTVCCSVLQCVAVCCSVLWCVDSACHLLLTCSYQAAYL